MILLALVVLAVLELTNTTHLLHKQAVPPVIPVVKTTKSSTPTKSTPKPANSSGSAAAGATQTPDTNNKLPSGTDSGLPLVQPFGTFVSNHRPGQDGSNNDEQSACNTTPGAKCYIQFTNLSSNVTTKLPAQTVGSDGSTIWSWNVSNAGLTSGSWRITAVASLNGQTKSATDTTNLEVQ